MSGREAVALAAVAMLAIAGVALSLRDAAPVEVLDAAEGRALGAAEREVLALLDADFGGFAAPRAPDGGERLGLPAPGQAADQRLLYGARTFRTQCAQCHGTTGRADTSTAALLTPRPRDFGLGLVKFTSTAAGARARREDLERTLRDGIPYTAMSSFARLREPALGALADYTLWILVRGELVREARERLRGGAEPRTAYGEARAAVFAAWDAEAAQPLAAPAFDPDDPEAARRGAALYADPRSGCAACHGEDGGGRGPAVWDPARETWLLRDAWGFPAQPRDLRRAQYHGGAAPEDLYRRIHAGVKGTPMPAHGDLLTEREIADLVAWLRAAAKR
jgi:mono/diheme cytochrome c family protein